MRFLMFILLLFMPFMALPVIASIPSTAYMQQQLANQIATAVADKADISALETLSTKIGNFPDYSLQGWVALYNSRVKEVGWPAAFLGTNTWDIPTNIGAVIEVLLGKNNVNNGMLYTVFSAIYDRIVSVESKANTNASAISTRVDTAQTANQTMAGTYTVSGTMNITGAIIVPTATLPTAE